MPRTHIFLLNPCNTNVFAHNCDAIPFRSFQVRTNPRSGRRERQPAHASMEEKLHHECLVMRHQGKPVKRGWLVRRGKQILDELEPDHNFFFRIIGLRGSRTDITYH